MFFEGYQRADGSIGCRNLVGIISSVCCANEVTEAIARRVAGAVAFTHGEGCGRTPADLKVTEEVLVNLGQNPNLGAVLVVGLGCESTPALNLAEKIRQVGKPVESVVIQQAGGMHEAVSKGVQKAQKLAVEVSSCPKVKADPSQLVVAVKCGASDTTSGLAANPAVGKMADLVVQHGGRVIIGETTEFIGAEHLLLERAADENAAERLKQIVTEMENSVLACGVDMRGGQPTKGNIAGGLTTIEEKSLGAIVKGGTSPINEVIDYGRRPSRKGLVVMDSPGREPEILTGFAAAGAQIIVFTTGLGAPQGFPFVPVMKVCANIHTVSRLSAHIDFDLSKILAKEQTVEEAGELLFKEVLSVANGKKTQAEANGYFCPTNIWARGPVI
ncbi:MAG: UxaA family hydrolase [Dethiobacteria bacterium]|nr:UxaA family hydrolase [Bacillota bacterium]